MFLVVWPGNMLEIASKPNGLCKAFDQEPPGFLHELKIPIQTELFLLPATQWWWRGRGGGGWLINMPVKKSVVNCSHIIGKSAKFGGHS